MEVQLLSSRHLTDIDHALSCSGALLDNSVERGIPNSASCPQSYLLLNNRPPPNTSMKDAKAHQENKPRDGRRKPKSGDWLITDSALFAYNAMGGRSHAEDTELYAWLQKYHGKCGPESDCASLRRRLEALNLNTAVVEETTQDKKGFLVPRPNQGAASPWSEPVKMPIRQNSRPRESNGPIAAGDDVATHIKSTTAGVYDASNKAEFIGTL